MLFIKPFKTSNISFLAWKMVDIHVVLDLY